ncbi:aminotransferase class V-fold PLP-dependent enzyme, partial [bacterium]|nr:aminotransferase class V-fold PLP-dependent enzyme [bacterium]
LFIRDETWLRPMIWGGSQERQLRAGTESTPAILAFADAVALAESERETMIKRLTDYKHRLIDWLPSVNGRLNGDPNGLATTVNIRFPEISGESIVRNLDLMGIAASTGSACATGSIEPSHVINALNLPESDRRTPFRISMGRGTQADDILTLQTALETILTRLRNRR